MLLVAEDTGACNVMCSVVAKVYQLWGAAGLFWGGGRRGDIFCYFGVFKQWNQRPNSKQPLLFKIKFILFAEYTCKVDC